MPRFVYLSPQIISLTGWHGFSNRRVESMVIMCCNTLIGSVALNEINYPETNGMRVINTMGAGSYTIKATGLGQFSVRLKSYSVPVAVTLDFPKKIDHTKSQLIRWLKYTHYHNSVYADKISSRIILFGIICL